VAAPLGLGTQANESQGHLRPGDRLVCYTDGLVEARNTAGEFLDRPVFEQAAATGSLPAALDRLVELVDGHTEGRHDDDLALLGLEYDRSPESTHP
jgi:serine phosphatase RsbU (regulator of sigma subunit)